MSLENAAENCRIGDYPDNIHRPAAVNYMKSLGAVVACGGYSHADSSSCWAFDGSSWTPLPDSTQHHCWFDSPNLIVDKGMWVTGLLEDTGNGDCSDEWTSEIFTGDTWIPGPQHPADYSLFSCLAEVNSTHSILTGGYPTQTSSWLYDWTAGSWSESNELSEGRYEHGCAVLEGQGVLVAGGYDDGKVYSVELYDPQTGIWTPQPSLPQDIEPTETVLLPLSSGTVIALFYGKDEVYQRLEDGTWSAMEGVVLPSKFQGYRADSAVPVPADFGNGYGCM